MMMKCVTVSLIDPMFRSDEFPDIPMFDLHLAEIPQKGDELFVCNCENIAEGDQSAHLWHFCLDTLPKQRFFGFSFMVASRVIHRQEDTSHVALNLEFIPEKYLPRKK